MQQTNVQPNGLTMTDNAARKATELLQAHGKAEAGIRVYVKSGGCSGYTYGMAIDDRTLDGDSIFEHDGIRMIVDKMSLPLLEGSQVDYVENMMGGGFSVINPNATSACGCGHSFRTDGQSAPDGQGSSSCH